MKKEQTKFTVDERKVINSAAQRVWDEIGSEIFTLLAAEGVSSIPRAEVFELVLDADRLMLELRRKDKELAARISKTSTEVLEAVLTDSFRHVRYGA